MLIMGKKSTVALLVLIGVVLVSIGSGILISNQVKLNKYVKTQAVVVGHKVSGGEGSIGFDENNEVFRLDYCVRLLDKALLKNYNLIENSIGVNYG